MKQTLLKQKENLQVTNQFLKDYQIRLDSILQSHQFYSITRISPMDKIKSISYKGLQYIKPLPHKFKLFITTLPNIFYQFNKPANKENPQEEKIPNEQNKIVSNVKQGLNSGVQVIKVSANKVKDGAGVVYQKLHQYYGSGWNWLTKKQQVNKPQLNKQKDQIEQYKL